MKVVVINSKDYSLVASLDIGRIWMFSNYADDNYILIGCFKKLFRFNMNGYGDKVEIKMKDAVSDIV